MRNSKKLIGALVLASCLSGKTAMAQSAGAQRINLGYNAVEVSGQDTKDFRARAYADIGLSMSGVQIGYHGLNEMNNLDPGTFFGKEVFTLGKAGASSQAVAVMKLDSKGIIDVKYGVRNTGLPKKLSGYGYLDIAASGNSAGAIIFYGRGIGKGVSVETLQDMKFPFTGRPSVYSELQLNREIGRRGFLFGRAEVDNFNMRKGRYLVGIGIKR